MQLVAFFFAGNLAVEGEEQWRRKRERDREACSGRFFFFFLVEKRWGKKYVYFFFLGGVFLGLEIGMECNK